jgi:heme exporter protein A
MERVEPKRMNPPEPAVETKGISRRFGRRWALVDVSLRVTQGTVVMVTGRNGSGKSTLLRVLSTAIRADGGSARVAGYDIRAQANNVRASTALLSHTSYHYEALTALENLQITARFQGRESGRRALLPKLAEVGLASRADDAVGTFSAGMRKRLSLARTLLQPASVVFLDEPYAQLDPPGFQLVDGVLANLRRAGKTVLMATHLVDRVRDLADFGAVLEEGRLLWSGPASEVPGGLVLDAPLPPEIAR